jgi:hypothetical protein
MQLAHLAEQNRTRGTDLTGQNGTAGTDLAGMTIKGAIRHLAPPKSESPKSSKPATAPKQIAGPKPPTSKPGKRVTHINVIEQWIAASPDDRTRAVDAIGLNAYLAAMPGSCWPLIEKRLAERNTAPAPTPRTDPALIPDDLSIPECLRRTAKPEPRHA